MTRVEFTKLISALLIEMDRQGESPIADFCKRSDQEQARLYRIGRDENGNKIGSTVTECDGVNSISAHQRGLAMDIYFQDTLDIDKDGVSKELIDPVKGWEYWHQIWENWGGKAMMSWDKYHFEG